ncbi:acyltransferase [Shewanella insulae]|uniref:acyltransferase n=1 Tax=Shewanella insulae TaxID=2681496 RepID=UPI001EFC520A|nr:acyltransferase [Shewanella insulae]MCG9714999.1 acyltransferase [Shewanella insulae]
MSKLIMEIKYQLRYSIPIWFIQLLTAWLPDIGPFLKFRGALISIFLPNRPKGFRLGRDVTLLSVNRLFLGNDVYFAKGTWINAIGKVYIGSEVSLAPYVVISSTIHGFKNNSVHQGGSHPKKISIGYGSWLAAHTVISAGVNIGSGAIIGANSVVTHNIPDNVVAAGLPCKIIKERIDNPSNIRSKHEI